MHSVGCRYSAFILFCLLFISEACAQTQPKLESSFLLRIQKLTLIEAGKTGGRSECIIVYPSGRYRLEYTLEPSNDAPRSRVNQDLLPGADMKRLSDLLNAPALISMNQFPKPTPTSKNPDALLVEIMRGRDIQNILSKDPDSRSSFDKRLRPLLDWFKLVGKRKAAVRNGAIPNGCDPMRNKDSPQN